ncbi:MAG: Extracellular serine protease precursor [Planctomycetes bacterium ADurb.Bin126]|nr:MAG: Extracellular serine protease precursor [Planctomycetes bacterium ADurb.Bin126]HQL73963.1 autotransporter-associated beta strand repeat-containing protein [Phycisphaerae bacterium]
MKDILLSSRVVGGVVAVVLAAGWAAGPAAAATWDGGAGTLNWGDGSNWNPDGVPPITSLIQFNGGVPGGTTVNVNVGTYSSPGSPPTEVDLNNAAGFRLGNFVNWTYWPTLKVQDAQAYTIASGGRLAINGTMTIDIASGGSLTVDGGFTAAGYGTANVTQKGLGTMYLIGGRPANASSIQMIVQNGTLSSASVNNLGTNYLAAQLGGRFEYTGTGSESKTGLLYANNGSGTFDVVSATADLTFNITGGDLSSGGGTLTKAGAGTMTLATSGVDIAFNKPLAITGGTLALQANGSNIMRIQTAVTGASGTTIRVLPGGGTGTVRNDSLVANWSGNLASLDVQGGATFDLRGNQVTVAGLSGSGTIINSYYRPNSGIQGDTLTVGADDASSTFAGSITGTGTTSGAPGQVSLNKIGSGTLALTGANTYGGSTTVSAGTLAVGPGGSINSVSPINVGSASAGTLAISGGSVTASHANALVLAPGAGAGTLELSGGELNLTANPAFVGMGTGLGTWNQSGGVANVTGQLNASQAAASQAVFNFTGGTYNQTGGRFYLGVFGPASMTIANTASVNLEGMWMGYDGSAATSLTQTGGTLVSNGYTAMGYATGLCTWTQQGGSAAIAGQMNIGQRPGGVSRLDISGGTFTQSGGTFYLGIASDTAMTVSGSAAVNVGTMNFGLQAGGPVALNLAGGTLRTTGMTYGGSGYAGPATVRFDGGTLEAGASFSTPTSGNFQFVVDGGGATFDTMGNSLTIPGSFGVGSGAGDLTKTGAGTLTLSGDYSGLRGDTIINQGTLVFARSLGQNAWHGGTITVNAGGVLDSPSHIPFGYPGNRSLLTDLFVNGGSVRYHPPSGSTLQFANLRMAGGTLDLLNSGGVFLPYGDVTVDAGTAAAIQSTGGGAGALLLRNNSHHTVFDIGAGGSLDVSIPVWADGWGGGYTGLNKTGEGTLTLAGVSTYTGPTTVSAGTLLVDGTIVSPVSVVDGGTLGGTGVISAPVSVAPRGHVAPGDSAGTLSTGPLALAGGSFFDVEIDPGAWDSLLVAGEVDVTGAILNLMPLASFSAFNGSRYLIVDNDGADDVVGRFDSLLEGALLEVGGSQFAITYFGGTGNDIVLTSVPEPLTLGLWGLALGGIGRYVRRRRRQR